jgi:hypothetical protein
MKRCAFLALMLISITTQISIIPLIEGTEPVELSGYKPTYYPPNYDFSQSKRIITPLDTPIARSLRPSNSQVVTQGQVQITFNIVGDSNQPIVGAEFSGLDGAGNSIWGIADESGYVNIIGVPGNWQFSVSAPALGYYSTAIISPFTYSSSKVLKLQTIGPLEKLNLSGHTDKGKFTSKLIIMPSYCSNITEPISNLDMEQPTYTGEEG